MVFTVISSCAHTNCYQNWGNFHAHILTTCFPFFEIRMIHMKWEFSKQNQKELN